MERKRERERESTPERGEEKRADKRGGGRQMRERKMRGERWEQSLQVQPLSAAERGPFLCNLWFHSASVSDDCLGEEKAILRGTGCVKRIVSPAAHPSMSNQPHGTEGQQNYWRRGWLRQKRQWYGLNPHLEVPFPHLTPLLKCYFSMLWNVIALWWNRSLQLGR